MNKIIHLKIILLKKFIEDETQDIQEGIIRQKKNKH